MVPTLYYTTIHGVSLVINSPYRASHVGDTHEQMPQGYISNVEFYLSIHTLTQIVALQDLQSDCFG